MRFPVALLGAAAMLTAGACSNSDDPVAGADDGPIEFTRNSEFSGPRLRVFLDLPDGTPVSVNVADDAVATRPGSTVIPGHQARDWTFVKDDEIGTSVVYALVSWDPENPADYLMAGWWAQFPDQHLPQLTFAGSQQYAIVDGPENDPASPPELPLSGQATYAGQAGGLYSYALGSDWGDAAGSRVLEEWEGRIALTADFAAGTVGGCRYARAETGHPPGAHFRHRSSAIVADAPGDRHPATSASRRGPRSRMGRLHTRP